MKKVGVVLLALLVLIAIISIVFGSRIDGLIAQTIRDEGTISMGTQVDVGSVVTDIAEGTAVINSLTVANPVGYRDSHAIVIDTFTAEIDYQNLEVESIIINAPKIFAEMKGKTSNFQDLINGMPEDEIADGEVEDDTELTIKVLEINDAQVTLRAGKFNILEEKFVLDNFRATDLQGTSDEISDQISRQLSKHVQAGIANRMKEIIRALNPEEVKEKVEERLKEGKEALKENKEKVNEKLKGLKSKFGFKKD